MKLSYRVVQWAHMGLVLSITEWITYNVFSVALPQRESSAFTYFICIYLALCVHYYFFLAASTSPGRVPHDWKPVSNEMHEWETDYDAPDLENVVRLTTSFLPVVRKQRFCDICGVSKPPRSHHCKYCQRCVLRYDHHCVYAGNCIGHYNQRFFIGFLAYVLFSTLLATFLLVPHISTSSPSLTLCVFVCIVICTAMMVCTAANFAHILSGETIVEGKYGITQRMPRVKRRSEKYVPVFHQGSWRENGRVVFGTSNPWKWLIPFIHPPLKDGLSFKSVYTRALPFQL